MKRFLAFFIFYFSFYLFLTAQQTWYFGNGAGIKFSKEGVQLLHDGKIYTNEGCSAAYNEKGELIFYSVAKLHLLHVQLLQHATTCL